MHKKVLVCLPLNDAHRAALKAALTAAGLVK